MKWRGYSLENPGERTRVEALFPRVYCRGLMLMVLLVLVMHAQVVAAIDWRISGYSPATTMPDGDVQINGTFSIARSRHSIFYGAGRVPASMHSGNRAQILSWRASRIGIHLPSTIADGTYWLAIYDDAGELVVAGPRTLVVGRTGSGSSGSSGGDFGSGMPKYRYQGGLPAWIEQRRSIDALRRMQPDYEGELAIEASYVPRLGSLYPIMVGDLALLNVTVYNRGSSSSRSAYILAPDSTAIPFPWRQARVTLGPGARQVIAFPVRVTGDAVTGLFFHVTVYLSDEPAGPGREEPTFDDRTPRDNSSSLSIPVLPDPHDFSGTLPTTP